MLPDIAQSVVPAAADFQHPPYFLREKRKCFSASPAEIFFIANYRARLQQFAKHARRVDVLLNGTNLPH
jgi:hypothetical protein